MTQIYRCIYFVLFMSFLVSCEGGESKYSVKQEALLPQSISPFDVSVLYPLPTAETEGYYLKPNSISQLNSQALVKNRSQYLKEFSESLYLIGFRLDPCFPGLVNDLSECSTQLRMIMQPMDPNGGVADVAFHLFFEFEPAVLKSMIAQIHGLSEQLGIDTSNKPLQVHPGFKHPRRVEFFQGMQQILLSHISSEQLIRITSNFGVRGTTWTLSGFDIAKDGSTTPMEITGLKKSSANQVHTSQKFVFDVENFHQFIPQVDKNVDSLDYLTSANDWRFQYGVQEKLEQSLLMARKIENPHFHSPKTTDCVSCHVAQQTIEKGEVLGNIDYSEFEFSTTSGMNMQVSPHPGFQNMRIFGYHLSDATVARRAVYETAAVLEFLQQHYR